MKTKVLFTFLLSSFCSWAASTINPHTSSNSAWGANIGWINWRADGTNGAVIGEFICSGYIYGANVGWINLGSGFPVNGIRYSNTSATDFGVNHDGAGKLRGYAYGANIGWINFEDLGNPRVNLQTGVLHGYAWGANVGWISLSNAVAVVKTDSYFSGNDKDEDGIPDAWEVLHAGILTTLSGGNDDEDGDGFSDGQEYLADTNPLDPNENLRITAYSVRFFDTKDIHNVTWTSRPSRFYKFNFVNNFDTGFSFSPIDEVISPDSGITTTEEVEFSEPSNQRYLRIEALRPLTP